MSRMIIYIKPRSLFPTLHSDTIFGALLSSMKYIYPEKFQDTLLRFKRGDAPFLVSSAFPFMDLDGEKIKLLPKPLMKPERQDLEAAKNIRKVRYVEEIIFKEWAQKGERAISSKMGEYQLKDGILLQGDHDVDFKFDASTVPRNTINRITNTSENIFYSSGVSMEGLGLFFLVKFMEDSYEDIVKGLMRYLEDRGFGGDISIGKGQFTHEVSDEEMLPDTGNYFVTLSRYIPRSEEILAMGNKMWYEIGSKRGRGSDGILRKKVNFFQEGSTFKTLPHEIYGQVVQSASEAVEYGLAYPVGLE